MLLTITSCAVCSENAAVVASSRLWQLRSLAWGHAQSVSLRPWQTASQEL